MMVADFRRCTKRKSTLTGGFLLHLQRPVRRDACKGEISQMSSIQAAPRLDVLDSVIRCTRYAAHDDNG
ncbi:hypothetical protein J6590_090066 [Homalodisca vitripennis]|nr:hypothetical protein J6590_090066 [Homalodisca vitripennis]